MKAVVHLIFVIIAFTSGHKFYDEFQNDFSSHSFNEQSGISRRSQVDQKSRFNQMIDEVSQGFVNDMNNGLSSMFQGSNSQSTEKIFNQEFFGKFKKLIADHIITHIEKNYPWLDEVSKKNNV